MRLFPRSVAAAILTAGCCLSILTVNVLAQSPPPGPSTSAPDLSDQKLRAVAAALERVASLQQDYLTNNRWNAFWRKISLYGVKIEADCAA
jgi:hypothetical protein